ncbi:hypothetical protein [Maridesulfovibrio sp.]|uniref:hypothetical protein n=1 Tax=Maridesulfovibrio sp. TaxID=2795000 RepID=UPI002AA86F6A|nr:hypothetical protein [Maridesulfovibrio sp.]
MLESRPVPGADFNIDSLGRLKNIKTGNYMMPSVVKGKYYYSPSSGSSVKAMMGKIWPEAELSFDRHWWLATREYAAIKKAQKKAKVNQKKNNRLELEKAGYWGAEVEPPPEAEWRTHPKFPKVELSDCGLLRKKVDKGKAYRPTLSQKGNPVFSEGITGGRKMALFKAYREVFHKNLPEYIPADHRGAEEFMLSCPYARDMIQTLYGSGKPDAQFSPLDWFHDQLPEAVIMRIQ